MSTIQTVQSSLGVLQILLSTGGLQIICWLVCKIRFYSVSKTFRANGYGHDTTEIDVADLELESSSVLGEAEQNEDMLSLTWKLQCIIIVIIILKFAFPANLKKKKFFRKDLGPDEIICN